MRSTFRLFMAAILFTAAAGFASAQESSEPPPPPALDAAVPVVPVAELPPIPVAVPVQDTSAPAVDPALTIDPSALAVAPAAVEIVQAPEPEMEVITTATQPLIKNTAKKPVEKPVTKPVIEATETYGPMPAEAAVAAANTAPAKSEAPPPAAVKSTIVETPAEGTESESSMGIGGWLIGGIVVAALAGLITLLRRRRTPRKTSIEFPAFGPELKSAPVTRN